MPGRSFLKISFLFLLLIISSKFSRADSDNAWMLVELLEKDLQSDLNPTAICCGQRCSNQSLSSADPCEDLFTEGIGKLVADDGTLVQSSIKQTDELVEQYEKSGDLSSILAGKVVKTTQSKIFPKVKSLIRDLIERSVADDTIRGKILSRLNSIQFKADGCLSSRDIGTLLSERAEYLPEKKSVEICNGFFLKFPSEFAIAHILAHEIAHSFDPCQIASRNEPILTYTKPRKAKHSQNENPFPKLLQCLRDRHSVDALTEKERQSAINREARLSLRANKEVESLALKIAKMEAKRKIAPLSLNLQKQLDSWKTEYEKLSEDGLDPVGEVSHHRADVTLCNDQITESFSDWIAGEILPQYISAEHPLLTREQIRSGYVNAQKYLRHSLEDKDIPDDLHPSSRRRINGTVLVNPVARRQMGCFAPPRKWRYCPLGNP